MCLVLTYDYFSVVIISQWDEVFNTDLGICSNTLSGLEVRVRAGRTFVGPSLLWGGGGWGEGGSVKSGSLIIQCYVIVICAQIT